MTDFPIVAEETAAAAASNTAELQYVAFRDIGIAPENVRAKEPADAGVQRLADTIHTVGILIPLLVRKGGKKGEKPTLALDGRRRLFALECLLEAGAITDDYPVPVIFSADRAAQAAAAIVANDERLPIHIADVIVAIGKLRRRRYSTADIAAALAYPEMDIKRLTALSELDSHALTALRGNKINMRQARLLARLPDKETQRQLADQAISGYGFSDHHIIARLERARIDTEDARFPLVGLDRYRAAGGRCEGDLFGELPDVLRDPEILDVQWRERVQPVIDFLRNYGVQVYIADGRGYGTPEGVEASLCLPAPAL